MALIWVEGFENYGVTLNSTIGFANGSGTAPMNLKYPTIFRNFTLSDGRFGGYAAKTAFSDGRITTPTFTTQNTWILGMAFYYNNAAGTLTATTLVRYFLNTTVQCTLSSLTSGQIQLTSGANNFTSSGKNGYIKNLMWNYLETKLTFTNTGSYEIRLNGYTILSGTGDMTATSDGVNNFEIRGWVLDDIYICDNTGSKNNDFLGDSQIVGILPNSDGNYTSWTPNSGLTHYSRVNEVPPTFNDSSYVSTGTITNIDSYVYSNISGTNFTDVAGLQVNTIARKDDGATREISALARYNGTDAFGSTKTLTSSYSTYEEIFEEDSTGTNWTETNINSAEFGMRMDT